VNTNLHRRQFLRATSCWLAAIHAPFLHASILANDTATEPRLLHLTLQSHRLEELQQFYQKNLELPIGTTRTDGFSLRTGPSTIQWKPADASTTPFYHFAWNIPENQFADAKAWLSQRTPLLRDNLTGKDEVHFAAWNAQAVYFRDPAGNIGELIARHTLKNRSTKPFSVESLQCVSEIGLVTDQVQQVSNDVQKKLNWSKSGAELSFVGDAMGYLIIAPIGRPWLPDRQQKAAAAPVVVQVNQPLAEPITWAKQPFTIKGKTA
jgi:hypothetical protein